MNNLSEETKIVAQAIQEINNKRMGRIPTKNLVTRIGNKFGIAPAFLWTVGNWSRAIDERTFDELNEYYQ